MPKLLGCLLTNSAITFGSVYLSLLLSSIKPIFLFMLVMPFCAVVLYLYAPADHENKLWLVKNKKEN